MSETAEPYQVVTDIRPCFDDLLNYLTEAQITQLAEALAFVKQTGGGYGQVRMSVERGRVVFMSFEISVKSKVE